MYTYLLWLSGVILGGFLGIGAGGYLVAATDLTGTTALLTGLLAMGIGASVLGSLFVALHRLVIMLNAFVSVALPTAYLLSAGAILSADLSLTSGWLVVPLSVSFVLGCVAAVLTWIAYKTTLVITTSFLGASFLVYIPVLAQSEVDFSAVGFPNVDFLVIFVSGIIVQAMIPEPKE